MELPLDAPRLYLSDEVSAVASHELARIEAAMPPETTGLDYVKARLVTPRQSFDVDTLLNVHQKSEHAARESYWLRLATIIACITTIALLLFSRSYFRILILRCFPQTPHPLLSPHLEFLPFLTQNAST